MVAFAMIVVAAISLPLWAQTTVPTKISAQKAQPQLTQTPAAAIAEVKVPNLLWLPRESALEALRRSRLQPDVTDDNKSNSVVIEQPTTPGTNVPVYSKVRYTIGQPVLKLEASTHTTRVNRNVQFTVTLTPSRPVNAERPPIVYEFMWKRGEPASKETNDTFVKQAPQIPGRYDAMVSAIVNDVPLESNRVEVKVEPKISVTPTPPTPTPTPTPEPHPKLLGVILLVAAILGTLAAAYGFQKLKKSRVAASARVKISTGNRRIKARILEPQSLKSRCLTRVRWVRGPLFSKMTTQNHIVKKKGAAHG